MPYWDRKKLGKTGFMLGQNCGNESGSVGHAGTQANMKLLRCGSDARLRLNMCGVGHRAVRDVCIRKMVHVGRSGKRGSINFETWHVMNQSSIWKSLKSSKLSVEVDYTRFLSVDCHQKLWKFNDCLLGPLSLVEDYQLSA